MVFPTATLEIVIGFMVLANRLTAALITPLFEHYDWDKFGIMYISWAIAGIFVWLSGANLFASLISNVLIGQILTAVVAGGGGNLLHDISDQKSSVLIANVPEDKIEYNVVTDLEGNDDLEPNTKDANGNLTYPSGIKVEGGSDNGELEK